MKLSEILEKYNDSAIDQLAIDKVDETATLRLPRKVVQQEVVSALSSLSYIAKVLFSTRPPTYAIIKLLLDSEGHCLPIEGFREKVKAKAEELTMVAKSGEVLGSNKNFELYKKILIAAWDNDAGVDENEENLLKALRQELGIWHLEHLLLEYHPEVVNIWNTENSYVVSRNRLLSTGVMLTNENHFLLAQEVVLQILSAWEIDLVIHDYQRLLESLTNEQLYSVCQKIGLSVSGSKAEKVNRIEMAMVPPHEVLDMLTVEDLSRLCSEKGIRVAGSKADRIANILSFFKLKKDLEKEVEIEKPAPPQVAETREMSTENYLYLLENMTQNQLYDVLSACLLKVSGSKEEKIQRLFDSNWSERSALSQMRSQDLSALCRRIGIRISGLKAELIDRLIEAAKPESHGAVYRAEIQEEEIRRANDGVEAKPVIIENLEPRPPVQRPIGLDELEKEYPYIEKDEAIILALLKEAKSLTERDIERASKRHSLGWFLTKAHMAELLSKLNNAGKNPLGVRSVYSQNIYEWLGNQPDQGEDLTRKSARDIIDALRQGVVPERHLDRLIIGQENARAHLIELVEAAKQGDCNFKFIRGPYGAGKSFLCAWLRDYALKNEMVISSVVVGPDQPLSDLPVFYTGMIQGLRTPEKRDGSALVDILESWLLAIHRKAAQIEGIAASDVGKVKKLEILVDRLVEEELANLAGLEHGVAPALRAFYRARREDDQTTAQVALSWLGGSQVQSTSVLKSIGVKGELASGQVFPRIRALLKLIRGARYKGMILFVDEVELIRRYAHQRSREQALETIRLLVDEVGANGLPGALMLFTGTDAFFEDERAGLKSYEALANRILSPIDSPTRSIRQPIICLEGLNQQRLLDMANRIRDIHGIAYQWDINKRLPDEVLLKQVEQWTEFGDGQISRQPRPVLREFVQMLDLLEENPSMEIGDIRSTLGREFSPKSINSPLTN
jgi:hypothetical protein